MSEREGVETRRGQEGYVAVSVVLTIVLLLGFAALAVDLGMLFGARTAAQRAADAGALAGAFTFVSSPLSPQPATANERALATTLTNEVFGDPLTPAEVNVNVDVANRRVTVDVSHDRGTFFARAFGTNLATIAVRAVAEASPTSTGSGCTKPWFIPNTVLSNLAPCDACAAGEVFIAGGAVTGFAAGRAGTQFTIKPGNPQNAAGPGQFYAIRMPGSTGGDDYRTNIATCSPDIVYCSDVYGVEPGNMIGPTLQGVRDLTGVPPADSYIAVGEYLNNASGTVSDTSVQLAVAPIWDTCNMAGFCPGNTLQGGATAQIQVIGFALVFIEGVQGNDVLARLIWASACSSIGGGGGGGGTGPAPPETGPYSIPVRLVRLP